MTVTISTRDFDAVAAAYAAVSRAASLSDLLIVLRSHAGDLVDWTNLPTFGGEAPADTDGVWSWSPTSLLVGTCADDLRIVLR